MHLNFPSYPKIFSAILLACACVIWTPTANGQDPIFSQFYAAPLQINPAFTGITLSPRVTLNYRSQWASLDGGYATYAAAFEQGIEALNSGVGLIVQGDNAMNGVYRTIHAKVMYAYQIKFREGFHIRFGIGAGYIGRRLDWEKLKFGDQLDPVTGEVDPSGNPGTSAEAPPENLNKSLFDLSAGLVGYGNKYYFGFAIDHFNNPNESFYALSDNIDAGLPMRWAVHGGYEFDIGRYNNGRSEAFISPNVIYIRQGAFSQLNAGAYVGFNMIYGGLWYRHTGKNGDALIGLVGFHYGVLRIGYSYDFTVSGLSNRNTGGTHEVSVTFNFADSEKVKERRRKKMINDCFRLFE